jgi:hypothetical protein
MQSFMDPSYPGGVNLNPTQAADARTRFPHLVMTPVRGTNAVRVLFRSAYEPYTAITDHARMYDAMGESPRLQLEIEAFQLWQKRIEIGDSNPNDLTRTYAAYAGRGPKAERYGRSTTTCADCLKSCMAANGDTKACAPGRFQGYTRDRCLSEILGGPSITDRFATFRTNAARYRAEDRSLASDPPPDVAREPTTPRPGQNPRRARAAPRQPSGE